MQDDDGSFLPEDLVLADQVAHGGDVLVAGEEHQHGARGLVPVDVPQQLQDEVVVEPVLVHAGVVQLQPLFLLGRHRVLAGPRARPRAAALQLLVLRQHAGRLLLPLHPGTVQRRPAVGELGARLRAELQTLVQSVEVAAHRARHQRRHAAHRVRVVHDGLSVRCQPPAQATELLLLTNHKTIFQNLIHFRINYVERFVLLCFLHDNIVTIRNWQFGQF